MQGNPRTFAECGNPLSNACIYCIITDILQGFNPDIKTKIKRKKRIKKIKLPFVQSLKTLKIRLEALIIF